LVFIQVHLFQIFHLLNIICSLCWTLIDLSNLTLRVLRGRFETGSVTCVYFFVNLKLIRIDRGNRSEDIESFTEKDMIDAQILREKRIQLVFIIEQLCHYIPTCLGL
jgi:hypothetical protein